MKRSLRWLANFQFIKSLRSLVQKVFTKMAEFKDANIILHELEQLFNRDDDIKDILDIRKMQSEIEAQCAAHLKSTKEIIRGKSDLMLNKAKILIL